MENWAARGIPSSTDAAQTQAVVGLLQHASTAIRSSRRRLDRVATRLFTLLPHARAALALDRADTSRATVAELLEEINTLGTEANEIVTDVTVAARSLSDVSSKLRSPLSEFRPEGGRPSRLDSTTPLKPSSPLPQELETVDEITRRDDVTYRS